MNFTENTVYSLKLTSGEEVVVRVIKDCSKEGYIEIGTPLSVVGGQNGIGLGNTMFTAKPSGNKKININNIMICSETDENVETAYVESTTGIALPGKKTLLG